MTEDTALEARLNNICLEDKIQNDAENGQKWGGMSLREIYRVALSFYRDKSGKAIHLSYEDNLKLVAFTQQATHGAFNPANVYPLGVLDVIGRDRRLAWQNLGAISKAQAMEGFINFLDRLCPALKPYVEAVKKDKEEKLRADLEKSKKEQETMEKQKLLFEEQKKREEQKNQEEVERRQLQDALNQQTFHQFKAYAEKQFPANPEQQAILIKQLQNEHYHQYMQQLQSQNRKISKINTAANNQNASIAEELILRVSDENNLCDSNEKESLDKNYEENEEVEDCNEYLIISPAKMWTRPDIKTFKQEVSAGNGDGVIHVGHGDTVTVRVPTHEGGNCIFWEFATDSYDIGFGIYFEWGKSPTNEVTVHISESDEDEEYFGEEDDEYPTTGDIECGPVQIPYSNSFSRPPISIIIPVYRRECHNEVYIGSHNYPGEGVYLLKFDNSFSIWRSKTLYYRIYYER